MYVFASLRGSIEALGSVPTRPPADSPMNPLGSIPRGFYEIAEASECSDSSPAFVRGLLIPLKDYEQAPVVAPPGQLSKTGFYLTPRWALYGGPIATRAAARNEWQPAMKLWAQGQGLVWLPFPDGEPCIVASHRIPWPANSSFQWTWVREVYSPRRVVRDKSSVTPRYVWEGSAQ